MGVAACCEEATFINDSFVLFLVDFLEGSLFAAI